MRSYSSQFSIFNLKFQFVSIKRKSIRRRFPSKDNLYENLIFELKKIFVRSIIRYTYVPFIFWFFIRFRHIRSGPLGVNIF